MTTARLWFARMGTAVALLGSVQLAHADIQTPDEVFHVDISQGDPWSSQDGLGWSTAYQYLRDAIDEAVAYLNVPGQDDDIVHIWVKEGTYFPDESDNPGLSIAGDQEESFVLHDQVQILGGFAGTETIYTDRDWVHNETILSGDLANDDSLEQFLLHNYESFEENTYHVVTGENLDDSAILDGFTVQRGWAGDPAPSNSGGGLLIGNSYPLIQNLLIQYNFADEGGAGMSSDAASGQVLKITDCTFYRNHEIRSGGGGLDADASGSGRNRVVGTKFIENYTAEATAAGAYIVRPEVVNCSFLANLAEAGTGGGAVVQVFANSQITNCVFADNVAAGSGGGLYIVGDPMGSTSPVTINQCTFSANVADGGTGGGIYIVLGSGTTAPLNVYSSILWENSSGGTTAQDQITRGSSFGDVGMQYSDVQDGVPSGIDNDGNNINADPDFRGPTNLYLQYGSPCIDTGGNSLLPDDIADLDGDDDSTDDLPEDLNGADRIQDGDTVTGAIVDMGAYEMAPLTICEADFNGNCTTNGVDLAILLAAWGPCPSCEEDLNGDGIVNGFDLALLLGMWGPCFEGSCGESFMGGGGEESEEEDPYPTLFWWFVTGDFASIFEWADSQ